MRDVRARYLRVSLLALLLIIACESIPPDSRTAANGVFRNAVVINCEEQCDEVQRRIETRGGEITLRYRNVPYIAANIDSSTLSLLRSQLNSNAIKKDILIAPPQPIEKLSLQQHQVGVNAIRSAQQLTGQDGLLRPLNYSYNNILTGATIAHEQGFRGQEVIVAVIDSGTANNSEVVPVLAKSVIGGESFVNDDPAEPSATSTLNEEHGTWIGAMIAGHGGIILPPDSELAQAVSTHSPESIISIDATNSVIPMFGTAPDASLYALKTFSASGGGTPSSVVLAAMDRALTLKTNFDAGMASEPIAGDGSEDSPFVFDSLNIRVVNMSLGGPTLFSGNEIDDIMTEKLLAAGIVVVTSAGNEGYAAMTGASPGTGLGSIAVGASNPPKHERILRDLQGGPGTGINFRPTNHIQMASFSSRGPTADGRPGVDIVANGFASFVQGADGHVSMVSGTSLSAPTISGAAALLTGAFPTASANDIRVALIESANPMIVGGRPSINDQGHGFLDINAALLLLESGNLDDHLPTQTFAAENTPLREILSDNGYPVLRFTRNQTHEARFTLSPGEVKQFFIEIDKDAHDVSIEINNVRMEMPPTQQNTIFGDDLMITYVDSPTSIDDTRLREFITTASSFNISHPQTGIARLAFMGDWTNVGNVSAEVEISIVKEALSPPIAAGSLIDKQVDHYAFTVTPEMTQVSFNLSWIADWSFYPTHDLDLIIRGPNDELILDGATLLAPEMVLIENPAPGEWTLLIEGFQLHDMQDEYVLRGQDQLANNIAVTPITLAPTPP